MASKYDTEGMAKECRAIARKFWIKANRKFSPKYNIGTLPEIVMNGRLTATAGRAWLTADKIDLSCYLYLNNREHFEKDAIPHELCHMIAFRLFKSTGHDKTWKKVVAFLNVETSTYHKLETLSQAKKRGN